MQLHKMLMHNNRKCTTLHATVLTIYSSLLSKMCLVGSQNLPGRFIANDHYTQKIACKINTFKGLLGAAPSKSESCLDTALQRISKSLVLQTTEETNHLTPLLILMQNIGNWTLFRPQQIRLLLQFHLKFIAFLNLAQ